MLYFDMKESEHKGKKDDIQDKRNHQYGKNILPNLIA